MLSEVDMLSYQLEQTSSRVHLRIYCQVLDILAVIERETSYENIVPFQF